MRLGEILIKYGLISQEHLDTALEAQKKFNCRLGKALVMVGYVTEDDINWALSNQLKISYVHLNYNMIDISVAKLYLTLTSSSLKASIRIVTALLSFIIPRALAALALTFGSPYSRAFIQSSISPKLNIYIYSQIKSIIHNLIY